MMKKIILIACAIVSCTGATEAQDSVDIVFRYSLAGSATGVTVPGEFNGWNNTAWPMTYQGGNLWTRAQRLRVNPTGGGTPGAYQYKFYYNGASPWPNDPLNHHIVVGDPNSNSFIVVKDPTIYHFLPNQRNPVVSTSIPLISAYIYPKVGTSLDTTLTRLTVDGIEYSPPGSSYNQTSHYFGYTLPVPLPNGSHTAILSAATNAGGSSNDTVTFITQSGHVQITTHGFETHNPVRPFHGIVQDTSVHTVTLVRNGTDSSIVPVTLGEFAATDTLDEGPNIVQAFADSAGQVAASFPVTWTLLINHAPTGKAIATGSGQTVILRADSSADPDGQTLTNFRWLDDPTFPLGLNGLTGTQAVINKPPASGNYYFGLIVTDPDGNADTSRAYFSITGSDSVVNPTIASIPDWAQKARVYFLFPRAASPSGTLAGAALRLQNIHDLGFNVLWLMPIMDNAFPIDQGYGPGYQISDFYNVAPEYGTNQEFKNFVAQAHSLGIKVILDVTPNHSSRLHPWSVDAHTFGQDSRYWTWYQHAAIPHNTNGLGQSADADNFWYYSAFSDQLLNFNWADVDMRTEMINVYKYWIKEFGVDGYRFDVYWGPHRRYGEAYMGQPVRDALKHIKPDILLLGEDDGTGSGTEVIYADNTVGTVHGGLDASYDFKLYFNQIRDFYNAASITNLHNEIDNAGFYPGEHALFMRFMESQDEDRIVYFYSNAFQTDAMSAFNRTKPMASVLFTAPGFPMIWNGQEVGWGYGIQGAKEARNRSTIDWNYFGRDVLAPHYQKLAFIRGQFDAFTQHKRDTNGDGRVTSADQSDFIQVATGNNSVYAFARPYEDRNGLSVVNFSILPKTVMLDLTTPGILKFSSGIQAASSYYVNDLYTNTRTLAPGSTLDSVEITLEPYGTSILTVSLTPDSVLILNPPVGVTQEHGVLEEFALRGNYPNPFNPTTTIEYTVGAASGPRSSVGRVRLVVYDMLGREVATLVNEEKGPGMYRVGFDGARFSSGVYFYRLYHEGGVVATQKMILLK